MEIDYNQLDKRFRFYFDAIEIIKQDKIYSSGLIKDYYLTDRLQILNEIDSFIKGFPERKQTYLKPLLKHYRLIQKVISENFGDDLLHSQSINNENPRSEKIDLLIKIVYDTDFIIKHLKELLKPEQAKQPEPPKAIQPKEKPQTQKKPKGQTKLNREQTALLFFYLRENSLIAPNIQNNILSTALELITENRANQYDDILRTPGTEAYKLGKDSNLTRNDFKTLISELDKLNERIKREYKIYSENKELK